MSTSETYPWDNDPDFLEYKQTCVRDFSAPYAIQWPGKSWSTRYKPVSDPLISTHLAGNKYWLATKAPWYPLGIGVDTDHPDQRSLERIVTALGILEGQYLVCTSPSYGDTGNFHLLALVLYKGKPATKKLIHAILGDRVKQAGAELYPQTRKKFRLPFGRDQYILDVQDDFLICAPLEYNWREAFRWLSGLEPFDLESVPHTRHKQLALDLKPVGEASWKVEHWSLRQEAQDLFEHGLVGPGMRHKSCCILAIYFYRSNWDISDTRAKVKWWIKKKHNGFSKEVNRENWKEVERDVDDIVRWTYQKYGGAGLYPDSTHNMEGWITPQDMRFIGEVFPGDLVNQRRLFELIRYYRPRSIHPWVFIPRWRWFEIANDRHYLAFRANLENRGLLESDHTYKVGKFPKRFQLHLPAGTILDRIEEDHRAVHDFAEVAVRAFGGARDAKEALRISRQAAQTVFT